VRKEYSIYWPVQRIDGKLYKTKCEFNDMLNAFFVCKLTDQIYANSPGRI